MSESSQPEADPRRPTTAVASRIPWARRGLDLLLLLGLICVFAFWRYEEQAQEQRLAEGFVHETDLALAELTAALERYEDLLRVGSGLFAGSGEVSVSEWRAFVEALRPDERFPALDGITFTAYVPAPQRAQFVADTGLAIFPAGERSAYYVIRMIEPHGRTHSALGYDIASDAVRRAAADRARDTGEPVMSAPVRLITPGGTRLDVLHLLPLYHAGRVPESPEERRRQLLGWVSAGYHVERLLAAVSAGMPGGLHLAVTDVTGPEPVPLFSSRDEAAAGEAAFRRSEPLDVGGRRWRLDYASLSVSGQRSAVNRFHLVPVIGVLVAFLLWYAGRTLVSSRERALAQVRESTGALAESEERYRQLFAANKAVELLIDPTDGAILDANAAAAAFYGWSVESLRRMRIGDINTLSPEAIGAEMQRAREDKRTHFFFRHRRADGSVRDVEVHSGPVRVRGRELLYSIVHDVTERIRAERALRESEEKYRSIVEAAAEGYWLIDARSKATLEVNAALCRMLGYRPAELLGRSPLELAEPASREVFEQAFARIPLQDHRRYEAALRHKEGETRHVIINSTTLRDEQGRPASAFAFVTDITEQKRNEEQLRLAATFYRVTSEAIMITDAENRIVAVNPSFCRVTGYSEEEALGGSPALLASGRHEPEFYARMWRALESQGRWEGEIWNRRKDGSVYPEWLSIVCLRDARGRPAQYLALFTDITQRKQDEEKIWRQANFCPVTGLPNRNLFLDRLVQSLHKARRENERLALLFVDLDRFKWVNDTYGHAAGDELLTLAAERLRAAVRESDTVARLGGDEFTVILSAVDGEGAAEAVARKLLADLAKPFTVAGHEVLLSASVGITLYPRDGEDADTLVANADGAMYLAKERGRNAYSFYTRDLSEQARQKLLLQNELRRAIARHELRAHFQPLVELRGQRVVGCEALVRWQHPQRGLIGPDHFIALAEETGLVVEIDDWMLNEACRQAAEWAAEGLELFVAVNLSSLQCAGRDCYRWVRAALERHGLEPGRLHLEFTERLMMEDSARVIGMLRELRDLGVHLVVDDFGTGYSSLSYLKRFPVSSLKIDRAFVAGLPDDRDDAALVEAIMAMAHRLGLQVVGEGIEAAAQLEFLRHNGCQLGQGFYFGRPVPAERISALCALCAQPA